MENTHGIIREMQIQLRTQDTEEPLLFKHRDLVLVTQQKERKGKTTEAKTKA